MAADFNTLNQSLFEEFLISGSASGDAPREVGCGEGVFTETRGYPRNVFNFKE